MMSNLLYSVGQSKSQDPPAALRGEEARSGEAGFADSASQITLLLFCWAPKGLGSVLPFSRGRENRAVM